MDRWDALEKHIAYQFSDQDWLVRALTHRSFTNEVPRPTADNQRMEFLGDAVLGLAISEELFRRYPEYQEGALSRLKARLVCEEALAVIAHTLGLGEALQLGRGEEESGGRCKPSLLADAFEALVAAVFLDGGMSSARTFVLHHHADALERITTPGYGRDTKSKLQELVQQQTGEAPRYHIIAEDGPPHARVFTAEVKVGEQVLGSGSGNSKKEAQREAAGVALEAWTVAVEKG